MSTHATREELNRAYMTFERAIDKLTRVLDDHSAKQEKMNDRMDQKLLDLERDRRVREIELDQRIKNLEEDKLVRDRGRSMVLKAASNFPKLFGFLLIAICVGVTRIINDVTLNTQKVADQALPTEVRLLESEKEIKKHPRIA